MRRIPVCLLIAGIIASIILVACSPQTSDGQGSLRSDLAYVTISRQVLLDKIEGGWGGQMAGVTWGAPTEFSCEGEIMDEVPEWETWRINEAFSQDDLYVEIPFLQAMKEHGVNASWDDYGDHFKDTRFMLWHANAAGRGNLQRGIPAPASGHYAANPHADDIDWQIEADWAGIITPGQPEAAVDLAWRAGHVMNYGDGVYGGVAVAAMHAVAYFAKNVDEIIQAGRQAVPEGSKYRQVIEDVIGWHKEKPTDWEYAWNQLQEKWGNDDRCPDGVDDPFNIDAKLNGAYVFIGLLYGEGDFEQSMRIAMRCGQDSDCNTSSVGGILGNWLGFSKLPDKFIAQIDTDTRFSYTRLDYGDLIDLSEELAREIVTLRGGSVQGEGEAQEWHIPQSQKIMPPILEQWPEEKNIPPRLDVSIEKTEGRNVILSAEASDDDGILEFQWYFGDMYYQTGQRVTHTYLQDGNYLVTGYVTDKKGTTSWQVIEVRVNE